VLSDSERWCRAPRTFVSTGLTETARTLTSKTRGPNSGFGRSSSARESWLGPARALGAFASQNQTEAAQAKQRRRSDGRSARSWH
jgi:hypothetical protein